MLSLMWFSMYSSYYIIYGYETSLYSDFVPDQSLNGVVYAISVLFGALSGFSISIKSIQHNSIKNIKLLFLILPCLLGISCYIMGDYPNFLIILIFFSVFMMVYSFGNTLMQGQIRRTTERRLKKNVIKLDSDIKKRVVSVICVTNSAVGTILQSIITAVIFDVFHARIDSAFKYLGYFQILWTVMILVILFKFGYK